MTGERRRRGATAQRADLIFLVIYDPPHADDSFPELSPR
jgi:hypothetical protein